MKVGAIRQRLERLVEQRVKGPDQQTRETARSYVWARAEAADGNSVEAWLDTIEAYALTAVASVNAVERVLQGNIKGAVTPATAFGPDFVLTVPGTKRLDALT
jgi:short subunit dehydrogenase-like uncharacterized protein